MKPKILLIEDDASTAASLHKVLCAEGYEVDIAARGDDGLARAQRDNYNVVVTDLRLPGLGGLELVAQLHAAKPKQPIILMTAHGTTETAIEATKLGACDYLLKPFDADELFDLIASAVASSRLMSEPVDMGEARPNGSAIIGNSRAMQAIYKEIGRVAATSATVLIRGPTGTGKELIARAIYQHSERADKPFIAVNCAAIPETILESELFGHERGAFTGAVTKKEGRFARATGGTLFLDEIGELSPAVQVKLLRVLQEGEYEPLGGNTVKSDVRIVAATNRDLRAEVQAGRFREDLYYRLNVIAITAPPLRARREDVPLHVDHFLGLYCAKNGRPRLKPTRAALDRMLDYPWPGNVRELENVIERAVVLSRSESLSDQDLPDVIAHAAAPAPTKLTFDIGTPLEEIELRVIKETLRSTKGDKSLAAQLLGISTRTIYRKLDGVTDEGDLVSGLPLPSSGSTGPTGAPGATGATGTG